MAADQVLTPAELAFLAAARMAVLATLDRVRRPRLVPICFVAIATESALRLYTPIDEKPKKIDDPLALARVRDILANPTVWLLVDRWSEDWSQLAWLRLQGRADLLVPDAGQEAKVEHGATVEALRAKYPQYASHHLEIRPIIRIGVERSRSWGNLGADAARTPETDLRGPRSMILPDEVDLPRPTLESMR
jgi:PPOX class probable F420-dependent enzyme